MLFVLVCLWMSYINYMLYMLDIDLYIWQVSFSNFAYLNVCTCVHM